MCMNGWGLDLVRQKKVVVQFHLDLFPIMPMCSSDSWIIVSRETGNGCCVGSFQSPLIDYSLIHLTNIEHLRFWRCRAQWAKCLVLWSSLTSIKGHLVSVKNIMNSEDVATEVFPSGALPSGIIRCIQTGSRATRFHLGASGTVMVSKWQGFNYSCSALTQLTCWGSSHDFTWENSLTSCGRLQYLPKMSTSQPLESVNVTLYGKRDWHMCFKLKILRWANCPGLF